jgi:hypothetical protein
MRDLFETEFKHVSGAYSSPSAPSGCGRSPSRPSKGNNGYGNGSDQPAGAPGASGDKNPGLLGLNNGKGTRPGPNGDYQR